MVWGGMQLFMYAFREFGGLKIRRKNAQFNIILHGISEIKNIFDMSSIDDQMTNLSFYPAIREMFPVPVILWDWSWGDIKWFVL